jgi:hypothetical protein
LIELIKASDWSTIGLIRPSLLRTESFFHNAKGAIETAQSAGNGAVWLETNWEEEEGE